MFGLPILSLISLGIAALIALCLMISVAAEFSVPSLPFFFLSAESIKREIERRERIQHAQINWGLTAIGFCLLAVFLAL